MFKQIGAAISGFFQPIIKRITQFVDEHLEAAAVYVYDHKLRVLLADAIISAGMYFAGLGMWAFWAHVLITQNFAFTYVSRARNSASLTRHLKAGFFSNGVWFASQVIIISKLFDYVQGKYGVGMAIVTGMFYTAFTLTGSILAHAQSLRTERGKSAVGASKKYVQVTPEEWAKVQAVVTEFGRISKLAEDAYTAAVDEIPDSGIVAGKVAGQMVVSGIPGK